MQQVSSRNGSVDQQKPSSHKNSVYKPNTSKGPPKTPVNKGNTEMLFRFKKPPQINLKDITVEVNEKITFSTKRRRRSGSKTPGVNM